MSHFTVTIELPQHTPTHAWNHVLDVVLEPFSEDKAVEPYRSYETGAAGDFWSESSLRENRYFDDTPTEELMWQQVVDAYNEHWKHPEGDRERMYVAEDGRAYTLTTANPDAKWDWWSIGGRWRGYFLAKHNVPDGAVVLSPKKWSNENIEVHARGCDGGALRYLDIEGTRNLAGDEAATKMDLYERLTTGLPEIEPWSEVLDRIGIPNIADARKIYSEQPGVQALKADEAFMWNCPVEEFRAGRRTYVERAMDSAVPGFAHLTLDGQWLARGEMGWWAMTDATPESTDSYDAVVNARVDSLDRDVVLVVIDCHI